MDHRKATFKLNGKKPVDFTIDRLGEYLRALSELVGRSDCVRITKITEGSVNCALAVPTTHYPAFLNRVASARNPDRAATGTAKSVAVLQEMITEDGVTAEIRAGRAKLFVLKGYVPAQGTLIGPLIQPFSVRGQIVGLEGKDATKHVRIAEHGTGREVRAEFRDAELGEELKKHLWKEIVELAGTARMVRHPTGEWEIRTFKCSDVHELDKASIADVMRELGSAMGDEAPSSAALSNLRKLRS